jgi:uncharacterized protein YkwD
MFWLVSFLVILQYADCLRTVYETEYETNIEYTTRIHTIISTEWTTRIVNDLKTLSPNVSSVPSSNFSQSPVVPDSSESDITTTITSTSITYTTLNTFVSEALVGHNQKRRLHQDTPDLQWSDEIAASAQDYADAYNCNGTLTHSYNPKYGENLALGYTTSAAVEAWYNEITLYDYSDPVFSNKTGHFTQLVWSNSTLVGCGSKYCDDYFRQYTVCQYYRPGNWKGEFGKYVKPLKP